MGRAKKSKPRRVRPVRPTPRFCRRCRHNCYRVQDKNGNTFTVSALDGRRWCS